VFFIADPY